MCVHVIHSSFVPSLLSNVACPKIRISGRYCKRNCLDVYIINVFQRWGAELVLIDFGAHAEGYKILLQSEPAGQLVSRGCRQLCVDQHSPQALCTVSEMSAGYTQHKDKEHFLLGECVKVLRFGQIQK